jgi:hypothetical protein
MQQTMPVPIPGQGGQSFLQLPNQPGANWWEQNRPPGPQQTGGSGGPTVNWSGSPDEIRQQVKAYAATRGYNMTDDEANVWVGYAPDLAARGQQLGDPNYGMMRLSLADQWTAPSQRYAAGSSSGGGPGTLSGLGQLGMDPGYQFRLDEGLKGLERGAAAKGTLLTGGTLKGLQRYAQDYASGEFGNTFNRNLDLARLGQFGASGLGNAAGMYGPNQAGVLMGQGNAQAAGTVGSGNAWQGTLSNLGQLAQYYAMTHMGQ